MALSIDTIYFNLKLRKKKTQNFRLRFRRADKWLFFTARRKRVNFLSVGGFAPFEKISAGAHDLLCEHRRIIWQETNTFMYLEEKAAQTVDLFAQLGGAVVQEHRQHLPSLRS